MSITYVSCPHVEISSLYRVFADGVEITVHATPSFHYAIFCGVGRGEVRIQAQFPFQHAVIRPRKLSLEALRQPDGSLAIAMELPCKVVAEFDGGLKSALFLLCNPPEEDYDDLPDERMIRFGPGFHDIGVMELYDGQIVHLAQGAWVRGCFTALERAGIRICGRGVLDASAAVTDSSEQRHRHGILLAKCTDVIVEGITIVNCPTWHVVPVACRGVSIKDVNILGYHGTGDGIDIVGCLDVHVEGCCIRVKDDCVAIKAVDYQYPFGETDVAGVVVENCIFWNDEWGNAMEIGYETRCEEIKDIVFRNIDVVHCEREGWQSGGVFTIHNGDHAHIHDILYENISVECADEKLIDVKILDSKYSKDRVRGRISNICFRDIAVVDGPFPVSILRGWEQGHVIENISIENLTILGQKILSWRDARMVVEITTGLIIR